MGQEAVVFKGSKDGILVVLDAQTPIEEIIKRMIQKFVDSSTFFSGGKLNISFTGRTLGAEDQQNISGIIKEIIGEDTQMNFNIEEAENRQTAKQPCEINESTAKFHKGTIRSGQKIISDGSVVVLGDVNPGAEVVAGGNIVVMGSLRGIVHAGYFGNRLAIVAALNLCPTQLRIADIITRSPDDIVDTSGFTPEIAYVKEDMIYIDAYLPKKNIDK